MIKTVGNTRQKKKLELFFNYIIFTFLREKNGPEDFVKQIIILLWPYTVLLPGYIPHVITSSTQFHSKFRQIAIILFIPERQYDLPDAVLFIPEKEKYINILLHSYDLWRTTYCSTFLVYFWYIFPHIFFLFCNLSEQ